MALTKHKIIKARDVAALNALIVTNLAADMQPIGAPFVVGESLLFVEYAQLMGDSGNTFTEYKLLADTNLASLGAKITAATGYALSSEITIAGNESPNRVFIAAVGKGGTFPASGGGSAYTPPANATAAELQDGTVTAPRTFSPKLIHDEIARQIAAIAP